MVDEREAERFRRQAAADGLSLSAWLRRLGRERIEAADKKTHLGSVQDVREFWKVCDAVERGREPDWAEHLAVIERSRRQGGSET